ncbi:MAG: hypothetical protein ACYDAG_18170 [Chloroflexota bacterium]
MDNTTVLCPEETIAQAVWDRAMADAARAYQSAIEAACVAAAVPLGGPAGRYDTAVAEADKAYAAARCRADAAYDKAVAAAAAVRVVAIGGD